MIGGRLAWAQAGIYMLAQLIGGILGGIVLWVIWQGIPGFSSEGSFGQNAFGDQSGNGLAWWAAFLVEAVATLIFLLVILSVTDERNEHPGLAPMAIGLSLAMIHFALIPLTGTSVNPARSIGAGLFAGSDAIIQLWLFILAPLVGGGLAGLLYPALFGRGAEPVLGSGLRFARRTAPGAVPGYGAPDAYQQQWNQQYGAPGQQPPPGQQWPPQPPHWQQQPQYPTGGQPPSQPPSSRAQQGWPQQPRPARRSSPASSSRRPSSRGPVATTTARPRCGRRPDAGYLTLGQLGVLGAAEGRERLDEAGALGVRAPGHVQVALLGARLDDERCPAKVPAGTELSESTDSTVARSSATPGARSIA